MDAEAWDERYRDAELVWSVGRNRCLVEETVGMPPGRALDVACGEGRNALWLAEQGWLVTATDFSPVGIDKAGTLADPARIDLDLQVADATEPAPAGRTISSSSSTCRLSRWCDGRHIATRPKRSHPAACC